MEFEALGKVWSVEQWNPERGGVLSEMMGMSSICAWGDRDGVAEAVLHGHLTSSSEEAPVGYLEVVGLP
jgi:hypothetical protein